MKRFHVHVTTHDLPGSIRFYSAMFGATPTVVKDDYAKWMLEDPRINFAVSTRGHEAGVNHLGLQVDSEDELAVLRKDMDTAGLDAVEEKGTGCCYARSDKHWVTDPQGIAWESFHTLAEIPVFSTKSPASDSACCVPTQAVPVKIDMPVRTEKKA